MTIRLNYLNKIIFLFVIVIGCQSFAEREVDENKLSIYLIGEGINLNINKGEKFVLETGGEVFMELSFVDKRGDIFVFNGFINSDFYDTGIWNFQNWFTITSDACRLSLIFEIPEKDKIELFKDKKEKKYTFKISSTLPK